MIRLLILFICFFVTVANAQTYYSWRYRTHATDCTALTDGKDKDLCYEQDAQTLYQCKPTAGDCSGSEWKLVKGKFISDPSACLSGQYVTDQGDDGTLTCGQVAFSELSGTASDSQIPDNITITNLSGTNSGDVTLAGTPDYITISGQTITRGTVDISDDTNLTAGDALTLTGDDIDFDGGTAPGGELGGTWASPTIDDNVTVTGWVLGDSTATTPAENDNDTSVATTAYVQTEISGLTVGGWTDSGTNVFISTTTDNVGIGTYFPSAQIEVVKNAGQSPFMISSVASADGDYVLVSSAGLLKLGKYNCSTGANGGVLTTDASGNVQCGDDDSGAGSGVNAGLAGYFGYYPADGSTIDDQTVLFTNGTNVGIGTNATTQKVTVSGNIYATGDITCGGSCGGGATGWTDSGTNVFITTTTDNVGIGTYFPSAQVEVVKNANQSPFMVSSVASANGDYLIILSGGNVGIGSTSPSQKLEIGGNIQATTIYGSLSGNATTATTASAGDSATAFFSTGAIEFGVGGTGLTSASDDTVLVSSGSAWEAKALTDCDDTGGNHLNYDTATNAFSCGTSGGGLSGWTDSGTNVALTTRTDNVGIGTEFPSGQLEIVKVAAVSQLMISSAATGDGDMLIVTSVGNIGVGTNVPSAKLQVNNSGSHGLMISTTATASGDIFVVQSGGNVGINSTVPLAKLEVNGTFAVRGSQTSPWSVKTGANTACNTTCGTSMAAFGIDDTNKIPLSPSDATADTCVCMGP